MSMAKESGSLQIALPITGSQPWRSQSDLHTMRFGSTAKVLPKCKLKYYRISECYIVSYVHCNRPPYDIFTGTVGSTPERLLEELPADSPCNCETAEALLDQQMKLAAQLSLRMRHASDVQDHSYISPASHAQNHPHQCAPPECAMHAANEYVISRRDCPSLAAYSRCQIEIFRLGLRKCQMTDPRARGPNEDWITYSVARWNLNAPIYTWSLAGNVTRAIEHMQQPHQQASHNMPNLCVDSLLHCIACQ